MKKIGTNENLINKFSDSLSLTSSKIYRIDIYVLDKNLLIDVYLDLLYSKKESHVKLKFFDIKEYSFIYNSNYDFYNVEIIKFFQSDKYFYISFDPVDESENVSDNDKDYILCENVEGYFV